MSRQAQTAEAPAAAAPPQLRPQLLLLYNGQSGHSRRVEGLAQVLQRRRNHDTFRVHRLDYAQHDDLARRCRVAEPPAPVVIEAKRVQVRIERPRGCTEIQKALAPWLR